MPKNKKGTCSAGFTLIELTFVAFLMLLVAGLSATAFRRSVEAWRTELATQDLLRCMTFARERAILERSSYTIRFSPDGREYWLARDTQRISGRWGQSRSLPRDMALIGGESNIVFYPDGTATPVSLELADREHRRQLVVDSVTGKGVLHEVS